jgi:predicted transcriptional regulator
LEDEIIVSIDQPEECIYHNLALLVRIGLLSKTGDRYATTPKGRKIYRQLNTL